MKKILFEDATLTSQAKVTIDGVDHLVTEAEYSGGTDLNASTFNELQDNVEEEINGIVESGENENGSWIKWADGTMICCGSFSFNATFVSWGVLYGYDYNIARNFPLAFASIKSCVVEINSNYGAGAMINQVKYDATSITQIGICRPTVNDGTYGVNYVAIGKWK